VESLAEWGGDVGQERLDRLRKGTVSNLTALTAIRQRPSPGPARCRR
jgi:hypothetical protein